jgi:hypothetical protein
LKKIKPSINIPFNYFNVTKEVIIVFHENLKFAEYTLDNQDFDLRLKNSEKIRSDQ